MRFYDFTGRNSFYKVRIKSQMVISHLYKNNDISRKITPGEIPTHQTPPWKISPRKIPSQKIPTRNIPTHFINCLSPTVRFDKCSQM